MAILVLGAASASGALVAAGGGGGPVRRAEREAPTPTTASAGSHSVPLNRTSQLHPPLVVSSVSIVLTARSPSASAVSIPTVVWYPLDTGEASLPLLVFSPGYQVPPSAYDLLTAGWAAAGYIVAEPTYPDTAPGAPMVESDMANHPGELEQVISELVDDSARGQLAIPDVIDAKKVAVAGQSDGGDVSLAAAADSCCRDPRIKAALILSGAESAFFGDGYFSGGSPPLLVVQGTADTVNAPACSEQIYDAAPSPRFYLSLPGATHLSAYTAPGPELSVVMAVTKAFLDGYLKSLDSRRTQLPQLGNGPVSQLISGSRAVARQGSCPGAP
jgi:predicted dienelactone hydrolase